MSLPQALLAILVGSVAGNLMLGAAGMIGADGRVPAMVLMRAPLGRRGSYGATGLNVAQCLGWATFEIIIIATAASALSDELFGFGGNTRSGRSSPGRSRSASHSWARSASCDA